MRQSQSQNIFDGVKKQRMMNQAASDFWKFDTNHDGKITETELNASEFNPSKDEPLSTSENANVVRQPGTQGVNNPTLPAPSPRPASTPASSNDVNQNFVGFKNEEEYMTHISNLTSEIMGGKDTISIDEAVEKLKTKFNLDETTVGAFKRNPIGTIPQDTSAITPKELSMMISMADRASGDSYDGNIEHIDLGFKNLREHPEQKISYDKAQETIKMWDNADNNKIYSSYNSANETDPNRKIVVGQSSDGKEITLGMIADMCKSTNLEATVGFLAEKTGQDTPAIEAYRDGGTQQTSFGAIKNLQQNVDGTYVFEIEQNGQTKKFTFDGKKLIAQ